MIKSISLSLLPNVKTYLWHLYSSKNLNSHNIYYISESNNSFSIISSGTQIYVYKVRKRIYERECIAIKNFDHFLFPQNILLRSPKDVKRGYVYRWDISNIKIMQGRKNKVFLHLLRRILSLGVTKFISVILSYE